MIRSSVALWGLAAALAVAAGAVFLDPVYFVIAVGCVLVAWGCAEVCRVEREGDPT
jgi:hypothetical protein